MAEFPPIEKTLSYLLCAEYTKRYQQILFQLPAEVFVRGTTAKQGTGKFTKMEGPLRAYIDLCAEEVFIHEAGMIPENVWTNWSAGIRATFEIEAIGELWGRVSEEARYADLKKFLGTTTTRT